MILLSETTHALELVTSSTSAIDFNAAYVDITTTTFTPISTQSAITTATTTTIVGAPSASTQRQIKYMSFCNKGASNNILTIQRDVSATNYEILPAVTLAADETLVYVDGDGFKVYSPAGAVKSAVALADADYGDITVTGTGTVMTIGDEAVTLAKMADIATARIIGRDTAGTGVPEVLTGTTARGIIESDEGRFNAYASSAQSINNTTFTKIQLDAESEDVSGWFDSTTNYRYTPTVAGTYLFVGALQINLIADQAWMIASIFKNGAENARYSTNYASGTSNMTVPVTAFIAMNGTTDYVELYGYHGHGSSRSVQTGSAFTYLSGIRIGP